MTKPEYSRMQVLERLLDLANGAPGILGAALRLLQRKIETEVCYPGERKTYAVQLDRSVSRPTLQRVADVLGGTVELHEDTDTLRLFVRICEPHDLRMWQHDIWCPEDFEFRTPPKVDHTWIPIPLAIVDLDTGIRQVL